MGSIWVYSEISDHPAILQAGVAATALYLWGACYCQRHLVDEIPNQAIAYAPGFDSQDDQFSPYDAAEALGEAGLWEETKTGWKVASGRGLVTWGTD